MSEQSLIPARTDLITIKLALILIGILMKMQKDNKMVKKIKMKRNLIRNTKLLQN